MQRFTMLFAFLFVSLAAHAQQNDLAVGDIDLDGVADTVRIDRDEGVLVCSLSSKGFKPQKSRPMESLRVDGNYPQIGLSAISGTFQIIFLHEQSSTYFNFGYNEKRKTIYLDEYWTEDQGYVMGDGAYEFNHNLRRRYIDYWTRHYVGPTDPDEYDETAYHTDRAIERVRKLRITFKKFSDEKYYRKTENIRNKYIMRGDNVSDSN